MYNAETLIQRGIERLKALPYVDDSSPQSEKFKEERRRIWRSMAVPKKR